MTNEMPQELDPLLVCVYSNTYEGRRLSHHTVFAQVITEDAKVYPIQRPKARNYQPGGVECTIRAFCQGSASDTEPAQMELALTGTTAD
jgi:hypothetical protein